MQNTVKNLDKILLKKYKELCFVQTDVLLTNGSIKKFNIPKKIGSFNTKRLDLFNLITKSEYLPKNMEYSLGMNQPSIKISITRKNDETYKVTIAPLDFTI